MWLRYQQVNARMTSFDPRDMVKKGDIAHHRHPLQRFEPTLRTTLNVVLPMNLDRLNKHRINIEKFAHLKDWKELNKEEINASRTVQQVQATIYDLEKIKLQIQHEDIAEFMRRITPMRDSAVKAIRDFVKVQDIIVFQVNNSDQDPLSSSQCEHDILLDNKDGDLSSRVDFSEQSVAQHVSQLQVNTTNRSEEMAAAQSWDSLKESLVDLNTIVRDFSTLVQEQQETIDSIEDNIEQTGENVHSAASYLAQASKYKATMIPMAGAVVGGLVGGPIGLMAGFKLAGLAAAVGGGVAGYQGGKYFKRKHDERVEVELDNLSGRTSSASGGSKKES